MLGTILKDPDGVEPSRAEMRGLELLQTSTTFLRQKSTHQVMGRVADGRGLLSGCRGAEVTAYEIHMGVSQGEGLHRPFVMEMRSGRQVDGRWTCRTARRMTRVSLFVMEMRSGRQVDLPDGAQDDEGLTLGTYLHGLFHNRSVRRSILEHVAQRRGAVLPTGEDDVEPSAEYDKLAALVREHLDMELVYRVTGLA